MSLSDEFVDAETAHLQAMKELCSAAHVWVRRIEYDGVEQNLSKHAQAVYEAAIKLLERNYERTAQSSMRNVNTAINDGEALGRGLVAAMSPSVLLSLCSYLRKIDYAFSFDEAKAAHIWFTERDGNEETASSPN